MDDIERAEFHRCLCPTLPGDRTDARSDRARGSGHMRRAWRLSVSELADAREHPGSGENRLSCSRCAWPVSRSRR